jgi:hypothetical protein
MEGHHCCNYFSNGDSLEGVSRRPKAIGYGEANAGVDETLENFKFYCKDGRGPEHLGS